MLVSERDAGAGGMGPRPSTLSYRLLCLLRDRGACSVSSSQLFFRLTCSWPGEVGRAPGSAEAGRELAQESPPSPGQDGEVRSGLGLSLLLPFLQVSGWRAETQRNL